MKKSFISFFLICINLFCIQGQTELPYLPLKDNFGGSEVNDFNNFVPNLGDYTLEVQGVAGTAINIAFSGITYTPATTAAVRFTQKDGKVYIFENGTFKTILIPVPQYTISGDNIIQNPSFEEVKSETFATGRWQPTVWDTWNGGMPTWGAEVGKTNVREDATYRSDGVKSIIMHSDTRQLLQELPANSLVSGNHYLLTYDYWTSSGNGNGGTTYQIHLRDEKYTDGSHAIQNITGHTTIESGTAKSSFSTIFQASPNLPQTIYFAFVRNESKVDWLDNIKMMKLQPQAKGISGGSNVKYLAGKAYAPESLGLENGDYIDMTERISNPTFSSNTTDWNITASGSKISTTEKGNGLIPGNQNHLQFWVGSGGIKGNLSQNISDLPNGKYMVKAAIVPSFNGTVFLYANTGKTAVVSGTNKIYEATGIVFDGLLELGLEIQTTGSSTVEIDDFKLYFQGTDVDGYLGILNAKIEEAKADTLSMKNPAGKPGYNNLAKYREVLIEVTNLPNQEISTILDALEKINAVINDYDDILEKYAMLNSAIINIQNQIAASSYPDKTIFNQAVVDAQAIYDSSQDQRDNIAKTIELLVERTAILVAYDDLRTAFTSAVIMLNSTAYAGKAEFKEVIDSVKAVLDNPVGKDILEAAETLKRARITYYNSQYTIPPVQQTVSWVDTSLNGSEKFVLRVDGRPFYMTNIQVRLDKLYGYEGWSDVALEAVIKRAADDGFNTVSIPIHWREVEPLKDEFDWTVLDKYMGWCKKYNIKMELLWFSWSSGGRVQYLWNYGGRKEPRTPDYVCSLDGKSEFNILRKEWEYSLDWRDTNLRDREKYVVRQVMDHVAIWDANNGNPQTVIGVQLGNEARGHGNNSATSAEIINYYHHVGAGVKESKYVVWTRLNCVSYETSGRINANESKRNSGGTNIDFVGVDIYGTDAGSIKGDMWGYLPSSGKNYRMIMEIDAKDSKSPIYQMAALAGDKAFDYYNMGHVDGNGLYTNSGQTLVERNHINLVRQRNKILNLANEDIALKKQGTGLYVYNYAGNSTATETGIAGIRFMPDAANTQAVAIRRSESEVVLLSTLGGTFTIPTSLGFISASKGYFNENNRWVKEVNLDFDGTTIVMPETSAVLLKQIPGDEEEVTEIIKNFSFEEGTYYNGTYNVPQDWTLTGVIKGADVQLKTGDAVHGQKRYFIWADAGSTIDFFQDIILSKGDYTVKAALKANAPSTTFIYATVGTKTEETATTASWNSWETTATLFNILEENTAVRIGIKATAAVMIDNFRLYKKENEPESSIEETTGLWKAFDIINCENGILVYSEFPQYINIYSMTGHLLNSVNISTGQLYIPLKKGMYIVGNRKVIVA